ncbi:tRNA (guanosine(37)-N1)-methyltransferase TrmD [Candidatus Liberibacter americanus]|uniref:tRNA (guanine-N(1)-)-methyltransferase n=1 Tax=Candidatus Liberibacter americanus str. Sao Paulo TaxID=1261131 RepID=U6B6W0_9HYPH|nr:tRNA (guanosine(37)-N1)-methyltransferase TrmD [Candidatus Liberibacter americanus]AHA27611.1 tRNA-(guanine-N1)-methyltransferase [Candidatus Liberibacter americanus str. Sao Paulo]EMS36319.1 tRNA (guanine-N(1)-)-methyltransferase [Candidatus Liberibacter americanus PW_SP]
MTFRSTIITLYPEMFPGYLGHSLSGKALACNLWSINTVQIRDFALDRHKNVDGTPVGGGAGMILRADVLGRAIDHAISAYNQKEVPRILMGARGKPLTQKIVRKIATGSGAIIICGRFEGIDERIIKARNLEEISIGDYVLSGGEPAALVLLDAIVRLLPGVMGNKESSIHESFENGLLEFPQYTNPRIWETLEIPPILYSGNHKEIKKWRKEQSFIVTKKCRPDLLTKNETTTE